MWFEINCQRLILLQNQNRKRNLRLSPCHLINKKKYFSFLVFDASSTLLLSDLNFIPFAKQRYTKLHLLLAKPHIKHQCLPTLTSVAVFIFIITGSYRQVHYALVLSRDMKRQKGGFTDLRNLFQRILQFWWPIIITTKMYSQMTQCVYLHYT